MDRFGSTTKKQGTRAQRPPRERQVRCCPAYREHASMREEDSISFDWGLWLQWIMVTTVGWVLGSLLLPPFGLAASGMAIGVLQWLVLQYRIGKGRQWIFASIAGWTAGWFIALIAVPSDFRVMAGIVLGAAVGTAQWIVLRREVHLAGWWIIISTLAWATGLGLVPGILSSGVMPGTMTGIALELLLRYPKQGS